jgi:hypothetical protein
MVDSGVQLIGSEESDKHFENPDCAEHVKDVRIVNMLYNEADDCWEPINYKKRREELMEQVRKMKS